MSLTIRKRKVKLWRKLAKNRVFWPKWAKFLLCAALIPLSISPFCSYFWRPSCAQNFLQVGLLERFAYLLSRTSGIFEFSSICPSKTEFSQHCFLCVKIGAVRSFFGCFWPFWGLKTYQKFLVIGIQAYFFMPNPKMLSFSHLEVSIKSERQVARRIGQKILCFSSKISKMQKVSLIFWNLGWVFSIKCCVGPRKP